MQARIERSNLPNGERGLSSLRDKVAGDCSERG